MPVQKSPVACEASDDLLSDKDSPPQLPPRRFSMSAVVVLALLGTLGAVVRSHALVATAASVQLDAKRSRAGTPMYYLQANVESGYCISAADDDAVELVEPPCSDGAGSFWSYSLPSGRLVSLKDRTKCLTVANNIAIQKECDNDSIEQQFSVDANRFVAKASSGDSSLCLSAQLDDKTVRLTSCVGEENPQREQQQWRSWPDAHEYMLRTGDSNSCLLMAYGGLYAADCGGDAGSAFHFAGAHLMANDGKCVQSDGSKVSIGDCSYEGNEADQWLMQDFQGEIKWLKDDSCLQAEDHTVTVAKCDGSDKQKWLKFYR